ncbi:DNA-directed RNA polymerase subunit epsilon [Vagococcus elongatus]|uniref:DNA-directed RNA polymerase subunit epsilon n=1 Tax=Vagococcus elongatus TaxID=180344 RepID=A0A430B474_9ENTE|nr:DNA-directed RNA polymerase subunit epsilon [Vagococcus elongatus]RSU15108.1 hypothetical protein CBF29_01900 [Vagococcus elongatus]
MIFKAYYQETKHQNPKREQTKSLYLEADDEVEARRLFETHTSYNLEFLQFLDEKHLAYEKEHADFSLTEFK